MLGLNLYIWINEIYILFEAGERLLLFQTNKLETLCEATGHKIRSMAQSLHNRHFVAAALGLAGSSAQMQSTGPSSESGSLFLHNIRV